VQKQSVHGGTIRVFISKKNNFKVKNSVKHFLDYEHKFGLDKMEVYSNFSEKVKEFKRKLRTELEILKKENKSIFGYGAPAKGNVLLNYCNIDTTLLDYIIDTTPLKQGKFTPGTHIPIFSPEKMSDKGIGHVALLLAWNYESTILEKEKQFREKGGKFLVPIPNPIIK
jgi:hypothetical protein